MKKIIGTILLIVIVAGGFYLFSGKTGKSLMTKRGDDFIDQKISDYEYTELYSDQLSKFSFNYPKNFQITEFTTDTGRAIVVQNVSDNIGLQIIITPTKKEDIDITEEVIKSNIPDIQITESSVVKTSAGKNGLLFSHKDENFGGDVRALWFMYKGNLYQLNTYESNRRLLDQIFETWKFQ